MTNAQSKDLEVSGSGIVIAIDGPSGSGKSTVSRAVAAQLDLAYLDTGAMYRAATWWCLDQQIDLANVEEVSRVVRELPLEIDTDPAAPAIAVAGTDVTEAIRESRISRAVSSVATNLAARAELVARQQEYVARGQRGELAPGGIIAEGRDITTVIAPDADVRILLIADEDARLARRAQEVHGSSGTAALDAARDGALPRGREDSTVAQILEATDGGLSLDNSGPHTAEAAARAIEAVRKARPDFEISGHSSRAGN